VLVPVVREVLKKSDALAGMVRDFRKLRRIPQRIFRAKRIRQYLQESRVRKLQLGSGFTSLPGWLCTDLAPEDGAIYLDVTKPFSFARSLFDYVFCEHLIEHLTWEEGLRMLQECHRVLKPGGVLRIATPDLSVILGLNAPGSFPARMEYVKWITDNFVSGPSECRPQFAINNAFHNWGHRFLYDGATLELALRQSGFEGITRCDYGKSEHESLQGIEAHGLHSRAVEMAIFETMIYEAARSA
jgi:SAM-dependent methyltransferase